MAFGDKLKQLREASGLKQEELGKIVNLSKATISRYEANTIEPNNETLKLIANYFNVSIDYLLGNSDTQNPYIQNDLDEVNPLEENTDTELMRLLKLAQGNRTLNAFARHADISPGNLSRIMNGQKVTPDTLKKIANKAYNNVTYEQLMIAAGYINEESKKTSPAYIDKVEPNYIKKDSENLPENKKESSEPKLATTEMVIDKLIKAGLLKDDKIDARIANMLLNSLKIDIELKLKEEEKKKGSS